MMMEVVGSCSPGFASQTLVMKETSAMTNKITVKGLMIDSVDLFDHGIFLTFCDDIFAINIAVFFYLIVNSNQGQLVLIGGKGAFKCVLEEQQ